MRNAATVPVALSMLLAITGCEPPPPVELGPQGSGGLASSGQGGDGQGGDETAPDGDVDSPGGLPTASETPAIQGQSLVDAGRGQAFAQALDPTDVPYFQQAEISARGAFVGSTITWRNPGSSTVGTITVLSERTISGQQCRDFFLTATIGGRQRSETATACNTGSGWVTRSA